MRSRGAQFRVRFAVDGDGKIVSTFEAVHAGASRARQPVEGLAAEVVQLSDRLDKTAAATRQYAQDQAVLDAALKQGLLTAREHTRLMEKAYAQTPDGERWRQFGENIGRSMLWAGGAVAAATALVVRNTMAWENQLVQLEAVLGSTGNAVGMTRDQLVDLAEELSRVSTFGRNEIVEAETRLLSYSGIVGTNFPRAMQAVIDQSARLQISLAQSAETIGRALESPSKAAAALAQQGFGASFTEEVRLTIAALEDAGREADAQILILEILEESYAGAAQAARDTFGGAVVTLKNRLADLMTGSDGSLDGATGSINDLIDTLNDDRVVEGFDKLISGAVRATEALAELIAKLADLPRYQRDAMAPMEDKTLAGLEEQLERLRGRLEWQETNRFAQMGARLGLNDGGAALREEMTRVVREISARRQLALSAAIGAKYNEDGTPVTPAATAPTTVDTSDLDLRTKEQKAAAKKAAEDEARALEQLQNRMQSYLGRLEQANALHGDNSELARANYEIQASGLDALNPALAESIRRQAELRDSLRESDELRAAGERVVASNRTALDRLNESLAEYDRLLAANAITQEAYATAVARARAEFEESEERIRRANRSMTQAMLEDWGDLAKGMDYALADSLDNISAALTDLVTKGETDVRRLGDAIIETFTRVLMNKAISDLLRGLGEGMQGAGGIWGWIGGALAGSRATGGGVRGGALYEITEHNRPEVLRQGNDTFLIPGRDGMVLPALPMAPSAGAAAPMAAGGLPAIRVEVQHRGGGLEVESAEASRQPDGTLLLRMQTAATQRAFAGGDMDDMMANLYGLQRRGRSRG